MKSKLQWHSFSGQNNRNSKKGEVVQDLGKAYRTMDGRSCLYVSVAWVSLTQSASGNRITKREIKQHQRISKYLMKISIIREVNKHQNKYLRNKEKWKVSQIKL